MCSVNKRLDMETRYQKIILRALVNAFPIRDIEMIITKKVPTKEKTEIIFSSVFSMSFGK